MLNIVINKYSISVRKNVVNTKHCVYYSQGGTRKPINYYHMPNIQENQKFDHSCPQGLSFCGQR